MNLQWVNKELDYINLLQSGLRDLIDGAPFQDRLTNYFQMPKILNLPSLSSTAPSSTPNSERSPKDEEP